MHVCSSAAATAAGTPEPSTIVVQIWRSAACTRRALPEAAITHSSSSAFVSTAVSVAGAALAIVERQSASFWPLLGVVAGRGFASAVECDLVAVVEVEAVAGNPLPRRPGRRR